MAKKAARGKTRKPAKKQAKRPRIRPLFWLRRLILAALLTVLAWVGLYAFVPPPTTPYILSEGVKQGTLRRNWVGAGDIAPVVFRSIVAAEDANFCLHWGFDMAQLRAAIAQGGERGASTLTQQTVKNAFLWHGRSWPRKALEAALTPVVELFWSKQRILEIYANVAEFDTGVFGIEAAAQHHFGTSAKTLTANQAALLAAVLPNPKGRQAVNPSTATRKRAAAIADGAATIQRDGRAACFQ